MPNSSSASQSDSFFSSSQEESPVQSEPEDSFDNTTETAIIYCEGSFGDEEGAYTTRLLQHSEKYRVLSVIDSRHADEDTGTVLGEDPHGIPLRKDLASALELADRVPGALILGAERTESTAEREVILAAIDQELTVVNAWLPLLADDKEFVAAAEKKGVRLVDLQKPQDGTLLKTFTGAIKKVTCPILTVLGTDTEVGKRDTAIAITRAMNNRGIRTIMISTGQSGLTQGARYGVVLKALPEENREGELEAVVLRAVAQENPELIVIEGQGALGHQENDLAGYVLRGGYPSSVVLQHAPKRKLRASNPELPIQPLSKEVALVEAFAEGRPEIKVIGVTLNPENMSTPQLDAAIVWLESNLTLPVIAPLTEPSNRLVKMVADAFPKLKRKLEGATAPEEEETE